MKNSFAYIKDEEGQGMVEYALIVGLVSVVSIILVMLFGQTIRGRFDEIKDVLVTD